MFNELLSNGQLILIGFLCRNHHTSPCIDVAWLLKPIADIPPWKITNNFKKSKDLYYRLSNVDSFDNFTVSISSTDVFDFRWCNQSSFDNQHFFIIDMHSNFFDIFIFIKLSMVNDFLDRLITLMRSNNRFLCYLNFTWVKRKIIRTEMLLVHVDQWSMV